MKTLNMYGVVLIVLAVLLFTMNESVDAKEYKVGDADGWKEPTEKDDYKEWASKITFHIGDSLRFVYKQDSVLVVDKWGYYHCNTSHPISIFKDGNTLFNIKKPAPIFFISGDKDHCNKGQRLAVDTGNQHHKSAGKKSVSVKLVAICLALVATSIALA